MTYLKLSCSSDRIIQTIGRKMLLACTILITTTTLVFIAPIETVLAETSSPTATVRIDRRPNRERPISSTQKYSPYGSQNPSSGNATTPTPTRPRIIRR